MSNLFVPSAVWILSYMPGSKLSHLWCETHLFTDSSYCQQTNNPPNKPEINKAYASIYDW